MEQEGNSMEAATVEPAQGSPFLAFLSLAWQRKSLVVLGAVAGLVVGLLIHFQSAPVYQSTIQLHVVKKKKPEGLPIGAIEAPYVALDDYLAEHLILIRSPAIVSEAVKMHNLQNLKSFEGNTDPTSAIRAGLLVNRTYKEVANASTSIFDLSFRGPVAEDCPRVLEAVKDSYLSYLDKKYQNVSNDMLRQITEARKVLSEDLARQQQEYLEFRKSSPLVWKGKTGTSIHQERLASIQNELNENLLKRTRLQGELTAIETALREGRDRSEIVAMINKGTANKSYVNLDERLFPLRLQEQKLLLDYGPDHPQVISVRSEMQTIREHFTGQSRRSARLQRVNGAGPEAQEADDTVESHREVLKGELSILTQLEQSLTKTFKEEKEEARKQATFELEDESRTTTKENTRRLLDTIISGLQQMNLARDQGGYSGNVIAPATLGWKVQPNLLSNLPVAIFLGLVGGFGLAYLADATDRSFRTPEEIRRRLGIPVVGHIPVFLKPTRDDVRHAAATGLEPILCSYYRPRSVDAESFRGVRTALYFNNQMGSKQIIQITSPNRGDGKSSLAANLAVSIAQSDKTVALLDADFRRPRQHNIFSVSNELGLASIISRDLDPSLVIKQTVIPGLSIIPCGPLVPNPAEVLTSPRFEEFLAALRKQYDFILIDTPPLLLVTDPAVVAPRVDGILLVVRISKNGRSAAVRAKDLLATLGSHVLGVVVNGVGGGAGRYGYRHYRYGYAYGHGYETAGYRYEREGYYSDEANAVHGTAIAMSAPDKSSDQDRKSSKKGFFRWI